MQPSVFTSKDVRFEGMDWPKPIALYVDPLMANGSIPSH